MLSYAVEIVLDLLSVPMANGTVIEDRHAGDLPEIDATRPSSGTSESARPSRPDRARLIRLPPARESFPTRRLCQPAAVIVCVDVFPTWFCGTVWPLQAQRPLGTAQLTDIVM